MTGAALAVRDVTVRFGGMTAVDGVSLDVPAGSSLGLVGESGSGKSTLARVVAGLQRAESGGVALDGEPLGERRSREQRRAVQLVHQDPNASMNPRQSVRGMLGEALRFHRMVPRGAIEARSIELLRLVRLDADALDRYPAAFSGGQRQRLAIARALSVQPRLLVADEPTSALDVSVQATVLDLLRSLRAELGLSLLFISHDLGVVHAVSDAVAVLREGRLVEVAPTARFFASPAEPYSRELLRAVPRLGTAPTREAP